MKKLMLFLALALAVALFVAPAFAEVQNVKVSGDVGVRTIARRAFDLGMDRNSNDPNARGNTAVANTNDRQYAITSDVGVNVNADLTDNVGVGIRLLNQRDWGSNVQDFGAANVAIGIDLASVTLKEFFYQPLTVVVGRQDLWFGKGFIVGSKILAHPEVAPGPVVPNTPAIVGTSDIDPGNQILADEFSQLTSFDAIRTTFDLNPWTVDAVYSIINNQVGTDGVYLYGANVGYKFDSYNAEAEGYFFGKLDRNMVPNSNNTVDTWGLRGSLEPIANMNLWAEGALQFGQYSPGAAGPLAGTTVSGPVNRRKAIAWDVGTDYTWKNISWQPKLGGEFIYYSGEDVAGTGTYTSWDQMYRGKFDTLIREYQGGAGLHYRGVAWAANLYDTDDPNDQPSFTNQMQFSGNGAVKLMDALNLSLKGTYFRAPHAYLATRKKSLGWELDSNLTYDYTEDVQFGLLTGWFFPGGYFNGGSRNQAIGNASGQNNSMASEVMTTMKVNF